jgi:hypothetical protein
MVHQQLMNSCFVLQQVSGINERVHGHRQADGSLFLESKHLLTAISS